MTVSKRWATAGLAATVLGATLMGCTPGPTGGGGTGGDEATPLKIGEISPLTGPTASIGQSQACGALVAADAINAAAGGPGGRVEIQTADSKGDPAEAARVAGKLTANGITFFGGGLTTSEIAAELPIFADAGAITTAGTSQAQTILTSGAMVARLQPDTAVAGKFAAKFMLDEFAAKTVAILNQDIEYSQELTKSATAGLGSSVTVQTQTVPFDEVNFASQIDVLLGSDPDVFFLPLAGYDKQVSFLRDYAKTGTDVPLVVGPSILSITLAKATGDSSEGVYGLDVWNSSVDNDASKAMKADFEKYASDHSECVDSSVPTQALLEYSSVMLYHAAVEKAGTRDTAKVYETILKNEWDLPQGKATFSDQGQSMAPQIIVKVENGNLVPVEVK